jgi:hypothetical protein
MRRFGSAWPAIAGSIKAYAAVPFYSANPHNDAAYDEPPHLHVPFRTL